MDTHRLCANTIKGLAMDAVQAANSGHPGMPMGMADAATVLWTRFIKHDPEHPGWPDRDRFVLSAGHGSMLLYSLLHLSGYDLSLDDLKQFRQLHSRTPGHPEYGETPGVETTTGPLGQGFANGVGMALTERFLRERFGPGLVDHFTYGIVSDGDLMEGIASEAASLAGHLQLGRIVYLYDDNHITIDGDSELAWSEDVPARFRAYGWHVVSVDGHDPEAVAAAITEARAQSLKPSLVCCRTLIGHSSSLEGSEKTHGAPLGEPEIRATKERLGMDPDAHFAVPEAACAAFRDHDGPARRASWEARLAEHPNGGQLSAWLRADGDAIVRDTAWPTFDANKKLATRKASQACLRAIVDAAPQVLGGSADLTGSNGVALGRAAIRPDGFGDGQGIHFGVREHAMAAICNGMALHGGIIPYCATFLVFHDYMRPSVRLSSLLKQRVIYVYSHDSVLLGEDGPTHQPIETLLALRAIPGVRVLRPADPNETTACWQLALTYADGPTALVVTRQGLAPLPPNADAAKGGYVVRDCEGAPGVVLMGTGSEVGLALAAAVELEAGGIPTRVLSVPCRELLWEQDAAYRDAILPPGVVRVSIEAGTTLGWDRYIGDAGLAIGIDRFGLSAPAADIAAELGLTPSAVAERVRSHLGR